MKTFSIVLMLCLASHGENSHNNSGRPGSTTISDYPSLARAVQRLSCLMPENLLTDTFRISENSFPPEIKAFEDNKAQIFKNAERLLRALTELAQQGKIPKGLYIKFEARAQKEKIKAFGEGAEGMISVNLINSPTIEELTKVVTATKGNASFQTDDAAKIRRTQFACEILLPMGAVGFNYSGDKIEQQMKGLETMQRLAKDGYRLKKDTRFVEVMNFTDEAKPYYFGGKASQLILPGNASSESLMPFLEKAE